MSKEMLIKLLRGFEFKCPKDCLSVNYKDCNECKLEQFADYLLANGVIVPPFKIGGKVYQTDGTRIYESTILEIICTSKRTVYITQGISFDETAIGTSIFLTREEAEAKLKESEGNADKS